MSSYKWPRIMQLPCTIQPGTSATATDTPGSKVDIISACLPKPRKGSRFRSSTFKVLFQQRKPCPFNISSAQKDEVHLD